MNSPMLMMCYNSVTQFIQRSRLFLNVSSTTESLPILAGRVSISTEVAEFGLLRDWRNDCEYISEESDNRDRKWNCMKLEGWHGPPNINKLKQHEV